MKKTILSSLIGTGAAFAVALAFSIPVNASAQAAKGATLLRPAPVVSAVAPATPVMACPACKTEYTSRVDTTVRGAIKPTLLVAKHLCDGCNTTVKLVGTGKNAKDAVSHTCAMSGKPANCCD